MSSETNRKMNDALRRAAGRIEVQPEAEQQAPPARAKGNAGAGTEGGTPQPKRDMNRWIRDAANRGSVEEDTVINLNMRSK